MKKELTDQINGYIANVGVSYIKLHNLHWNIVGKQFKAVHEYLETLYDALAEVLDSSAEILKMKQEMPLASLKEYLEAATIQERTSAEIDIKTALKTVLEDMETLKKQAAAIRQLADENDEFEAVNRMEDDIENYSKTIWFIQSMLKG